MQTIIKALLRDDKTKLTHHCAASHAEHVTYTHWRDYLVQNYDEGIIG